MCLVCPTHSDEELCDLNTSFLNNVKERGGVVTKLAPSDNDPSYYILAVWAEFSALEKAATETYLSLPLKDRGSGGQVGLWNVAVCSGSIVQ